MTQELDTLIKKKRKQTREEYLKARKKALKLTKEERQELARKALQAAIKHAGKNKKQKK